MDLARSRSDRTDHWALRRPQGRLVVLGPGASEPIRLTRVAVKGDDLVLTGTVDVASLMR
jgi:hypothetical protein